MSLHTFEPEIAGRVGVNAAVLYQNILFWTEKNRANGKHIHDGLSWTYNSVSAWCELFPYLSDKQIRTALGKLVDEGLLVTGNYNRMPMDRTKWYAPADLPVGANDICPKGRTTFAQKGEAIPDSKPDIKPDSKHTPLTLEDNNLGIERTHIVSKQKKPHEILEKWASKDAVASFIAYRKLKSAFTVTAANRLAKHLQTIFNEGGDTDDALGMAEENGWKSIEPQWYFKRVNGNGNSRVQSCDQSEFRDIVRSAIDF